MKLRDSFHIFIGFAIMYAIGSFTEFSEYTLSGKIIGVPLTSIIIGLLSYFWEWAQEYFSKGEIKIDFKDVARTSLGTLLGGLFSLWMPNIDWLIWSTCIISILLVANDMKYFLKKR